MSPLPSHILPDLPYTQLVYVQGGPFQLQGIDLQLPDFAIAQYPVTQELWETLMGNNPARFKDPHRPVEMVSWYEAQNFLKALNQMQANTLPPGCAYRLPNEALWEYAARGGRLSQGYTYAGGNDLDKVGWYDGNSEGESKQVGLKLPNELGLYDMSGNVWEWCEDQYHSNLQDIPRDGSAWVDQEKGSSRVRRGGSWLDFALHCRSSNRDYYHPTFRLYFVGFRVVLFFPPGRWTAHSK